LRTMQYATQSFCSELLATREEMTSIRACCDRGSQSIYYEKL
jgi:hypothetical protein